jgi:hypothetical protein
MTVPARRSIHVFAARYSRLGCFAENASATTAYQPASTAKTPTGNAKINPSGTVFGSKAAKMLA